MRLSTTFLATLAMQDIFEYLDRWSADNQRCDFDDAGNRSADDILEYLTTWMSGC